MSLLLLICQSILKIKKLLLKPCFAWSIMAAKYNSVGNLCRTNYNSELIFDNISFPISLKDIPKFEYT